MNFWTGFFFLVVQSRAAAMAAGPIGRYCAASIGCLELRLSFLLPAIFLFPEISSSDFEYRNRFRPNRDFYLMLPGLFHDCADMFNKTLQTVFAGFLRSLFVETCDLTATRRTAIKQP
jgi:hypothetical protein